MELCGHCNLLEEITSKHKSDYLKDYFRHELSSRASLNQAFSLSFMSYHWSLTTNI